MSERTPQPETVRVSKRDLEQALDAMGYVMDTYFWEKWGYQQPYDRLKSALEPGEDDGDAQT